MTVQGSCVTCMTADPVAPSEIAEMVALPGATAVTSPVCETVAMAAALLLHCTVRPASVAPDALFGVATSWTGAFPMVSAAEGGVTDTDATGVRTVIVALPVRPSIAATTDATPSAIADTTPPADTVAIVGSVEVHVTARPVMTVPAASRSLLSLAFRVCSLWRHYATLTRSAQRMMLCISLFSPFRLPAARC